MICTGAVAAESSIAVATADAAVGQFSVYGGSLPDGTAKPAGPWSGINSGTVNGGAFGVAMPADSGLGYNQTATLAAPSGLTFASVTASRSFNAPTSWAVYQPAIYTSWENVSYGNSGGPGDVTVGNPSSLSISVRCQNPVGGSDPNPRCAAGGSWTASRMTYVLNDATAPTGTLTNGGGALLDGSWHTSGASQLTLTAADLGESGVFRAFLREGATTYYTSIDSGNNRCQDARPGQGSDYEFAASALTLVPCVTASQAYSPTFDLTQLTDGSHLVDVGIEDASGRERILASNRTLKTNSAGGALPDPGSTGPGGCVYQADGTTCTAPSGGGGTPSPGNGATGPVSGPNVVTTPTETPPADPGPVIVIAPTPPNPNNNGLNASPAAHISAFSGPKKTSVVSVTFGAATPVEGRLMDPTGKPIQGAKLTVMQKVGNGPWQESQVISTNTDGAFKYVAPAGKSRSLRFAYRANTESGTYDQTADVDLKVAAAVSIKPSRRVTSNGHSVTFTGRVPGTGSTRDRVVVLQAQTATGWFKFAYLKVDKHGRYSYTYRFRDTHSTRTYTFRAVAKPSGYVAGSSSEIKVKVIGR